MNLRNISLAIAAAAAFAAAGQKLATEVVVDRSVDAELPKASMLPGIVPAGPDKGRTPVLPRTSEYSLWADFDPSVAHSGGTDYTGLAAPDTLPGYVSAGYLPAYNLGIQAGYRLRFGNTAARAAVMFDGLNYHSDDNTVRRNTLGIMLGLSHRFKNNTVFGANIAVNHSDLRNPAYSRVATDKQAITTLLASAQVARRSADISYEGNFAFRHTGLDKPVKAVYAYRDDLSNQWSYDDFGTLTGSNPFHVGAYEFDPPEENLLHFDGRASYAVGHDAAFSFDVDADMLHSKGFHVASQGFERENKTSFIVGAVPAFDFDYNGIALHLGLRVDWSINTPGASVHVAPEVSARWRFFDKGSLYASATGGQRFYTLYDLMQYSVFAPGFQAFSPTVTPIDFEAGVRLGSIGGFSADAHFGYQSTRHAVMPAVDKIMCFRQNDIKGFCFGLRLDYVPSSVVELSVDANAYERDADRGWASNMDRAKFTLDSRVTLKPSERLALSLSHEFRYGRRYYDYTYSRKAVDMGNISDLDFDASFRLSDRFSLFGRVNNMLCRRVLVLPYLYTPGLTGLVGVNLRF